MAARVPRTMSIPPDDAISSRADAERAASATTAGLVYWDRGRGPVWMNASARTVLGVAGVGTSVAMSQLFHGLADPAGVSPDDLVGHVLSTGQPSADVRFERRRPDGSVMALDASASPVSGADGHVAGAVVTLVDAGARAARELEQRERQRVLESTIAAMQLGVVVHGRSGEIVQCNPAAERILGLTADQMAGRTSMDPRWQATHEDGSPFPGEQHPAMVALATGQPQRGVLMSVHRPDGTRALISINAEPIADGGAAPSAVVATFVDITESRASQRQQEELLQQVADLFNNAPCGYHAIGPDGTFVEINDTELAWLGVTREEVLGTHRLIDFMTPEGAALLEGTFPRLVSGEISGFEAEVDLVGRHGRRRRVLARGSVQRAADGRFTRTRTILVDVSALRRTQQALEDSQRLESLGRLTGGVAHAFNNMLTAIVGSAELGLESVSEDAPVRADLVAINEAARRGAQLVAHLVTYARQQVTAPADISLSEIVDGLVRHVWTTSDPAFTFTVDHRQRAVVRIDPRALEQALSSLVRNAVEATGAAGTIAVVTGTRVVAVGDVPTRPSVRPGEYGFVAVSDTGAGMAPDVQLRATEPFFTTKEFGRNAGLGLSIAHGVAAQAGGGLALTSAPGRGTTVTVLVPLAAQPADRADR